MVKTLIDFCYQTIAFSVADLGCLLDDLPPSYREALIYRIFAHDLIFSQNWAVIKKYVIKSCNIRTLNIYNSYELNDSHLKTIGQETNNLVKFELNSCSLITDEGLLSLLENQSGLEEIRLKKLQKLTSKAFRFHSPKLKLIKLRKLKNLQSDEILLNFFRRHTTIEEIKLEDNIGVKEDVIETIAKSSNENLKIIDVSGSSMMTNLSLNIIGENCPNLQTLGLFGCNKVDGTSLVCLKEGCPNLKNLELSFISKLSNAISYPALMNLPDLSSISLNGISLESEDILCRTICRLKNLKELKLRGVTSLNDATLSKIIEEVGENLEVLDISHDMVKNITDDSLKKISEHCTKLRSIMLSNMKGINGRGLVRLLNDQERCERITWLFLSGLSVLSLSGVTIVDDQVLFALADNCHSLEVMELKACRLITDKGICSIAVANPNIQFLVLSGIHNLTDKSIFALANHCCFLQDLFINGCANITGQAVNYLLDVVINRVAVYHDTPNAQPGQLLALNLDTGEYCRADLFEFPRY
ncbi:DgyrCDS14446 [Dimorphilus gyrociliatus]|uniref:DgyrCDS14446 n=1 Tax=Dimorphilus gyrociliatus TaxID=2664684 RepID=A0A7I8WE12_9ANNE|nr:DgyrCDS14446 [Dimorphilus gyrociliatus]